MQNQILILFCINTFSAVGYSLIAPLYPMIAREKGVTEFIVGLIFSSFAVSNVLIIPIIPKLVTLIGKRKLFLYAVIIEGSCTTFYGFIHFINFKMIFIIVSFVLRFIQGIGCALTSTLIYSIAASNSDEESMKANIGYMELAYSVGLTIGPLVASFFYHFFGIGFPFFVCGLIMIGAFNFLQYLVIEEVKLEDSPNFFHVLTNFNILLTFIAVIMDMLSTTFVYPVFATHLLDTFGLSVEKASFFFIIQMFTYFMTLQYLDRVSRILGSKLTMSVGMILNFVFVMFLGPVGIFPQSLFMVVFGLVGIGIAGALITIPAIVDLMESIRDFLNIEEDLANDYASGLYNLGVNLAESIGPIIGGYLTGKRSFNFSCYTISFSNLIYFCLYTSCNFSLIKEQLNEPGEEEDGDSKHTSERQKSTVLIGRRARFSRQFSIHSRYSFPNKIGRSRSLTKSITRLSGLMEMHS